MKNRLVAFYKFFLKYFLQGLFLLAPISVTLFILYSAYRFIFNLFPTNNVLMVWIALIVMIPLIAFFGYLGSSLIMSPIIKYFDDVIEEVPLIKVIYSASKDLLSAFVGKKKKFSEPVLVKLSSDGNIEKIGFITCKDLSLIGISGSKVAVYLPLSYAISGDLYIVPSENITPINAPSSEVMKFIVTGGITEIK